MSRRLLIAASLLFIVPLHGCSSSGVQTRGGQADPEGAWLQSHAHPLALEAENFDDLAFLRPLLEGKRMVQLGENTHGVREYNLIKARIVRFLHQELGYEVYDLDGQERRAYFRQEAGQRMAGAYDRLAVFLADNKVAIQAAATELGRDPVLVARQTAASMAWYIRAQSAPTTRERFERRDQGMAENLAFLLDELYPDQKVIVWGHNSHIRHDNLAIPRDSTMFPDVAYRTMGSWIHERYGDERYTVGRYAYRGQAAHNSGEVYEIKPAAPGSLEALLHGVGFEVLFLDLSQAVREPGTSWMEELITARHHGTTALSMVLRDQYDALLFIEEVTPRMMLY